MILLCFLSTCLCWSLGDRLHRSVPAYDPIPTNMDDAIANGWETRETVCDPFLGITLWNQDSGPNKHHALGAGFNPLTKKIVSLTVTVIGDVPRQLVKWGWWNADEVHGVHNVSVALRPFGDACGTVMRTQNELLGDRVVVNPNTLAWDVPRNTSDPRLSKFYHRGACVKAMGTHWIHDVIGYPNMTWDASHVAPVVPMYAGNAGFHNNLAAIFFTVPSRQQTVLHTRDWDGITLVNAAMCQNFCDDDCTFAHTHFWSTMHIYFRDYSAVTCDVQPPLTCGLFHCCPM